MRAMLPAIVAITFTVFAQHGFTHEPTPPAPVEPQKPIEIPSHAILKNPAIDFDGFLKVANEAGRHRQARRLTEQQFLDLSKQEGTLILDTRSAAMYKLLHIEGAVHLNFSDMTKEKLAKAIPDKNTQILIYCNNNFQNRPVAFQSKSAPAALNIPTFITLYEYGYRNVYELGPLLDADKTILSLVSSEEEAAAGSSSETE